MSSSSWKSWFSFRFKAGGAGLRFPQKHTKPNKTRSSLTGQLIGLISPCVCPAVLRWGVCLSAVGLSVAVVCQGPGDRCVSWCLKPIKRVRCDEEQLDKQQSWQYAAFSHGRRAESHTVSVAFLFAHELYRSVLLRGVSDRGQRTFRWSTRGTLCCFRSPFWIYCAAQLVK